MNQDNESDAPSELRMATAKLELLKRQTEVEKDHLVQAEQVLRNVVFPAFAAYEESDSYSFFEWQKSLISGRITFAGGTTTVGTTGAELKVTRSGHGRSSATLRVVDPGRLSVAGGFLHPR